MVLRLVCRLGYEARYPKAVDVLIKNHGQLLTVFDFPAEHWIHLRRTNRVESPFATVKTPAKETKWAGYRQAGLSTSFKLLLAPENRWRRVNASHLVALQDAGIRFPNGQAEMFQSEKPDDRSLFCQSPSLLADGEAPIHDTWRYLLVV